MRVFASISLSLADIRLGNTNCFIPSGGGPDPNECHVISDALLYDSQNIGSWPLLRWPFCHSLTPRLGALFQLNPAANGSVITMQFRSCESFMVNQDIVPLTYCRTDWVRFPSPWAIESIADVLRSRPSWTLSPSTASRSRTPTAETVSLPTNAGSSSTYCPCSDAIRLAEYLLPGSNTLDCTNQICTIKDTSRVIFGQFLSDLGQSRTVA